MHQVSWIFGWYASKTIENGVVILKDGREFPARCQLQEIQKNGTVTHTLSSCVNRQTREEIPTAEVKQVIVRLGNPSDMVGMAAGVAKIALGAAYYLLDLAVLFVF